MNIEASSADNAKFMNEEFRTRINNVGLELDNNKPFRNDLNDALRAAGEKPIKLDKFSIKDFI